MGGHRASGVRPFARVAATHNYLRINKSSACRRTENIASREKRTHPVGDGGRRLSVSNITYKLLNGSKILPQMQLRTRKSPLNFGSRPDPDSGPKFTDDLRIILRQFSDLRQSCDNWRIHRTFTAVFRPIF